MKFYSGIGPRKVSEAVQSSLTHIAKTLSPTGWCLRSGYAVGCDKAFSRGAVHQNIFLPWEGYNGGWSNGIDKAVRPIDAKQIEIARNAYDKDPDRYKKPCFDYLSDVVMKLLYRNVPVILGENLDDPAECVITWSPTRVISGGTGHAVRIASLYGIPVFNMNFEDDQNAMASFVLNAENRSYATDAKIREIETSLVP